MLNIVCHMYMTSVEKTGEICSCCASRGSCIGIVCWKNGDGGVCRIRLSAGADDKREN